MKAPYCFAPAAAPSWWTHLVRQLGKAVPKNGGTEASDDQLPFLGQSLWGVLGAEHTLEEKQSEDSRKLAHTHIFFVGTECFYSTSYRIEWSSERILHG